MHVHDKEKELLVKRANTGVEGPKKHLISTTELLRHALHLTSPECASDFCAAEKVRTKYSDILQSRCLETAPVWTYGNPQVPSHSNRVVET